MVHKSRTKKLFERFLVYGLLIALVGCGSERGDIFIPPDDGGDSAAGSPSGVSVQFSPINNGLSGSTLDVKGLLAVNPLFAATKGGLMRSMNGGGNWTQVLNEPEVKVVAADPKNSQILYAGAKGGLFKSEDQGVTWTKKSNGIEVDSKGNQEIKEGSLLVHPADSKILYAGTKNGLYKSSDMAENWMRIDPPARFPSNGGDQEVKSLAIDPVSPNILYAGTRDGLFKSTDGGTTWNQSDTGITPDNDGRKEVKSLAIDPVNTGTLYAGTKAGVFKTEDGGATWVSSSEGIAPDDKNNRDIRALALDAANPGRLYAATKMGIFVTTDGGAEWSAVNKGLANTDVRAVIIDPADTAVIYAGTKGGIFKGTVTATASAGAPGDTTAPAQITDLSATPGVNSGEVVLGWTAPGDDGTVGIVTRYEVRFASSEITEGNFDNAAQSAILPTPVEGGMPQTLTLSGLTPGTTRFFAVKAFDEAGNASLVSNSPGTKVSTGGAPAWAPINTGLTGVDTDAKSLAIDPTDRQVLYAGTQKHLFKSVDGGQNWSISETGIDAKPDGKRDVKALAVDPINADILYAGTNNGKGPYRSTDGGANWRLIAAGLPSPPSKDVRSVAIDPTTTTTLYLGTKAGVFKSADSGANWTAASSGLAAGAKDVKALAIDPDTPTTLYAATKDGVYKSTDSGGTWTKTSMGITMLDTKSLAIDPTDSQVIYVGTKNGLFRTTDGGANWTARDTGITPNSKGGKEINAITINSSNPAILYAATGGPGAAGLFKSENRGLDWTEKSTGMTNKDVRAVVMDPADPLTLYAATKGGVFKSATGAE